jgi:hypothetical protein
MSKMPEPPPYTPSQTMKTSLTVKGNYFKEDTLELNPHDPFEKILIEIVKTNRKKRSDYAKDGNPFSNFEDTSWLVGNGKPEWSAVFNVAQKLSRLRSLMSNGRLDDTNNESSVEDTFLDMAVYAVIAYAIYKQRTFDGNSNNQ